jgi:sugar phosphate isomerase/epimerase
MYRRTFMRRTAALAAGAGLYGLGCRPSAPAEPAAAAAADPIFRISLAEWSLHRAIRAGEFDPLDFPVVSKRDYGIDAVEYVSALFTDGRSDPEYIGALRARCDGEGVTSVLIMVDGEGALGDADEAARRQAVLNHHRWVGAAAALGCHSIRVNAQSTGSREEQAGRAADGLRRLCEFGDTMGINVIVENHGGFSSDGSWLADVMRRVDHPRVGTLPDLGNFAVDAETFYDPYQGVAELMPYAKGVSAKTHNFSEAGVSVNSRFTDPFDYTRLMRIVLDAGYRGFVGIEYEGSELSEPDGIRASKVLLEEIRETLTPEYR